MTTQISHLLTVFNSSVNIYIYLIKHHKAHLIQDLIPRCLKGQGRRGNNDMDIFNSQDQMGATALTNVSTITTPSKKTSFIIRRNSGTKDKTKPFFASQFSDNSNT